MASGCLYFAALQGARSTGKSLDRINVPRPNFLVALHGTRSLNAFPSSPLFNKNEFSRKVTGDSRVNVIDEALRMAHLHGEICAQLFQWNVQFLWPNDWPANELFIRQILATRTETNVSIPVDVSRGLWCTLFILSFYCLFSLFHSLSITAVKSEAFYWPCRGARSTFISLTNILIFRGNVIEFPWFFLHLSCKCCRGVLRRCRMISRNRTRFAWKEASCHLEVDNRITKKWQQWKLSARDCFEGTKRTFFLAAATLCEDSASFLPAGAVLFCFRLKMEILT